MIFISHNKKDEYRALEIKTYLDKYNIESYIDVLDPQIKITEDITQHIISKLRNSTHLIVVFTENTKDSMWVPFELGAAYESGKGIGVFLKNQFVKLPEYLDAFPLMKDYLGLNEYIKLYQRQTVSIQKSITESIGFEKTSSQKQEFAGKFIKDLKSLL